MLMVLLWIASITNLDINMMDTASKYPLLHVTKLQYVKSILLTGIKPNTPLLSHHNMAFKKMIPNYIDSCIYTWLSSINNIKYLNDFVFYKMYGELCNKKLINITSDTEYQTMLEKLKYMRYNIGIEDAQYVILEIDRGFIFNLTNQSVLHAQTNDMNGFHNMPDKYCHNDKLITILTTPRILPTQIKVAGLIDCNLGKYDIEIRHRSKIHLPLYARHYNPNKSIEYLLK